MNLQLWKDFKKEEKRKKRTTKNKPTMKIRWRKWDQKSLPSTGICRYSQLSLNSMLAGSVSSGLGASCVLKEECWHLLISGHKADNIPTTCADFWSFKNTSVPFSWPKKQPLAPFHTSLGPTPRRASVLAVVLPQLPQVSALKCLLPSGEQIWPPLSIINEGFVQSRD